MKQESRTFCIRLQFEFFQEACHNNAFKTSVGTRDSFDACFFFKQNSFGTQSKKKFFFDLETCGVFILPFTRTLFTHFIPADVSQHFPPKKRLKTISLKKKKQALTMEIPRSRLTPFILSPTPF